MSTDTVKPISPDSIPGIMADKDKISEQNYQAFFNRCVNYINDYVNSMDWFNTDNCTAELPFSIWHDEFKGKIASKYVYKAYSELVEYYEKAGWYVCSSTGVNKLFYFTLMDKNIYEQKQKEKKIPKIKKRKWYQFYRCCNQCIMF